MMYEVGQRVRVIESVAKEIGFPEDCREGLVTHVEPDRKGVMVQHPNGLYGWDFKEVEGVE